MDEKPASPRVTHLLARAEQCREQARLSPSTVAAEALQELALEFEAEAALQAASEDLLKRRAGRFKPAAKP